MYAWIFRHLPAPVGSHHHRYCADTRRSLPAHGIRLPHFAEYGPFNLNVTINH